MQTTDVMKDLPPFISKKTASGFLKLGVYQIFGGIVGIISMALANSVTAFSDWAVLFFLLATLLFGYSILCGVLLFRTKEAALKLTLINQTLQLVGWAILGFGFQYIAGAFVSVGIDLTGPFNITLDFGLSRFDLAFNREPEKFVINFNLVALFMLLYTARIAKKVKAEKELHEFSEIGEE